MFYKTSGSDLLFPQPVRFGDRGGSLTDFTPTSPRLAQELYREQRIAIMDEVAFAGQNPVDGIGQIPGPQSYPPLLKFYFSF